MNNDAPYFWIIAGPNGSGKSTAYGHTDVDGIGADFWIVNPDLLTLRIQKAEHLDLGLAKSLGFVFRLVYVLLDSPERNVERVRERVLKGGHDVPTEKIVERYWRSLAQLPWFLEQADLADIYDNSGAKPRLVVSKRNATVSMSGDAPVNLRRALA